MRRARRIDPLAVVGLLIGVCVVGAVVLLGPTSGCARRGNRVYWSVGSLGNRRCR